MDVMNRIKPSVMFAYSGAGRDVSWPCPLDPQQMALPWRRPCVHQDGTGREVSAKRPRNIYV